MVSKKEVQFDFNADFGDSNYKSCFARSVVVNSQFHSKSMDFLQLPRFHKSDRDKITQCNIDEEESKSSGDEINESLDEDKELIATMPSFNRNDDVRRRLSCPNTFYRNTSPLEKLALQSQIDTLHWQLKQSESSRQMQRAVMEQMVSFLERAHRSLSILAQQQNNRECGNGVYRSCSEYHVTSPSNNISNSNSNTPGGGGDLTWRRRRPQLAPNEISPDKLSQEAFRLLRTVQSLLSTREPNLANGTDADRDFLAELSREFPSRPQRAASFSHSTRLLFQRPAPPGPPISNTPLRQTNGDDTKPPNYNITSTPLPTLPKPIPEKVTPNKSGSIYSTENESGFSSMNSYQEIGLPLCNTVTSTENEDSVSNKIDSNSDTSDSSDLEKAKIIWHRRWSSTPSSAEIIPNDPLQVLWV